MIALKIGVVILVVELLIVWGFARSAIDSPWLMIAIDMAIVTLVSSAVIHAWIIRSHLRATGHEQARTRASEERWKFALESAGAGAWELDLQSHEVYYSRRCKEILGYADDEIENSIDEWHRRTHPEDLPRVLSDMLAYVNGEVEIYQSELRVRAKDGSWRWVLERGAAISRSADGKPLRLIGTHADITTRRRIEDDLRALAATDPLTGVANRRHFMSRLEEAQALAQRLQDQCVSLLMLDIDHFKRINDTHGHPVGDAALKHLAAIMTHGLRKTDTVGRLGGEEFAIVLIGADLDAARTYAERLRNKVATTPMDRNGIRVQFTVSIGIATLDAEATGIDAALDLADQALYRAKTAGRNCVLVDPASAMQQARSSLARTGFVRLVWREAYACGHPQTDRQHQELFETSNRLLNAMVDNLPDGELGPMIQDMLGQITEHFRDEEEMLAAAAYPQLQEHRQLHQQLSRRAGELSELHRRGELTVGEVFSFVAYDIAARHMLKEDRKFFDFVRRTRAADLACAA